MAYEKQTWEDYPSTNTPITSDRLNHIEQGIYDNSTDIVSTATQIRNEIQALKRVTLYENANGTNTTLTLNDSVANYEDIEIFYKSNDNAYSSVKVNNANNKNICLVNMTPSTTNNVLYVKATIVKAQNDSITVVDGVEGYGSGGIAAGNKNYIVKVVGYKEV